MLKFHKSKDNQNIVKAADVDSVTGEKKMFALIMKSVDAVTEGIVTPTDKYYNPDECIVNFKSNPYELFIFPTKNEAKIYGTKIYESR